MSLAFPLSASSLDTYAAWLPRSLRPLVKEPMQRVPMWTGLAWMETVQSYRRTLLGPFWITLSLTITVIAMTLVYGALFAVPSKEYSAFVACGMIAWVWCASLLTEVGNTFMNYSPFITGTRIDKSLFIWTTCAKLVIVFFHQMIVWVGLALLGIVSVSFNTLLIFPVLVVLFLFSIPITAIASIVFTRYRDLPRLITSSIIVLMMVTPIFWQANMIKGWRAAVYYVNPVYYFIEFVREPLLGQVPNPIVFGVMLAMVLIVWAVATYFFRRYEKYVVFWL
jgi:lipopolysaccharide transport system permease protein